MALIAILQDLTLCTLVCTLGVDTRRGSTIVAIATRSAEPLCELFVLSMNASVTTSQDNTSLIE